MGVRSIPVKSLYELLKHLSLSTTASTSTVSTSTSSVLECASKAALVVSHLICVNNARINSSRTYLWFFLSATCWTQHHHSKLMEYKVCFSYFLQYGTTPYNNNKLSEFVLYLKRLSVINIFALYQTFIYVIACWDFSTKLLK